MRTERRKGIEIMMRLIGLVKPMLPIMIIAIILGILGYMCAISITVMAGFVFISKVSSLNYSVDRIFVLLIFMAVMRGYCTMVSSTATILSPLNCLHISERKFLLNCANFVLQN